MPTDRERLLGLEVAKLAHRIKNQRDRIKELQIHVKSQDELDLVMTLFRNEIVRRVDGTEAILRHNQKVEEIARSAIGMVTDLTGLSVVSEDGYDLLVWVTQEQIDNLVSIIPPMQRFIHPSGDYVFGMVAPRVRYRVKV